MAFCANCGAAVEGRFCPKCGTPMSAAAPPPPGYQGAASGSLGMDENLASALCYIPIIGLIFLIVEPYSKNRTIRFHALQSIFYWIAWVVISIALTIVWGILTVVMPFGMGML